MLSELVSGIVSGIVSGMVSERYRGAAPAGDGELQKFQVWLYSELQNVL